MKKQQKQAVNQACTILDFWGYHADILLYQYLIYRVNTKHPKWVSKTETTTLNVRKKDVGRRRFKSLQRVSVCFRFFRIYEWDGLNIRPISFSPCPLSLSLYLSERHTLSSPLCCPLEYARPSVCLAIWPFLLHLPLSFSQNAYKWGI